MIILSATRAFKAYHFEVPHNLLKNVKFLPSKEKQNLYYYAKPQPSLPSLFNALPPSFRTGKQGNLR